MTTLSRRRFAKLLTLSTSAALLPHNVALADLGIVDAPLPATPERPDERYWQEVRSRFVLPRDLGFLNAANLCPAPLPVIEALDRETRHYEADPSPSYRSALMRRGKEEARRLVAAMLGVTPEEIVLTRNTSEANNMVSNGLQLGPGDEVIVFSENHPTNLAAWQEKARRFGYSVITLEHVVPHPGPEYYVDLFTRAITPRTRVIAFTHLTSNSGDLLPAAEICRAARERGVLTLLDGAQTFGALAVNLSEIRPDFYSGSAHKWPCGPKEVGVLYVNREVHDRIWPSIVGVYNGAVGISRKLEGMGQRDDARMAVFVEALKFREAIGQKVIEERGRELALALMDGLRALDGVTLYTDPTPGRSGAIVVSRPGNLDPRRLGAALEERDRIVCTVRAGNDRPGLRFAPHLFNTMDEIDRTVGAIRRYLASGV